MKINLNTYLEASIAKLSAGIPMWVSERAVQVLGGYGYTKDFPAERFLEMQRYSNLRRYTEVQRLVIAREIGK